MSHLIFKKYLFFIVLLCGLILSSIGFADQTNNSQTLQLTAAQPLSAQSTDISQYETISKENLDSGNLFGDTNADQQKAFQAVTRDAMPMTPKQIVDLRQMVNETKRASALPVNIPPKPTLSTKLVNLSPGAVPPVIRLQKGFITTIVFVDATGADWPMESYDLGDSKAFNLKTGGSNVVMIQAMQEYAYTNLAIKLKGLSTPVMLTLVPSQKDVDYRIDLQIQRPGPNAKVSVKTVVKAPSVNNAVLLGVLNGIPPQGSKELKVSESGSSAWVVNKDMYLRTPLTLLSPEWMAVMTSTDGTNVYELKASPSVLVSKYGKPTAVKIEGL